MAISTLSNLRLRALALRSSIHNEHQLSAIELAGMSAKKTNELIDVVNDLSRYVEELGEGMSEIKLNYDELTESLNIEIAK